MCEYEDQRRDDDVRFAVPSCGVGLAADGHAKQQWPTYRSGEHAILGMSIAVAEVRALRRTTTKVTYSGHPIRRRKGVRRPQDSCAVGAWEGRRRHSCQWARTVTPSAHRARAGRLASKEPPEFADPVALSATFDIGVGAAVSLEMVGRNLTGPSTPCHWRSSSRPGEAMKPSC